MCSAFAEWIARVSMFVDSFLIYWIPYLYTVGTESG
jgi:hypothetical protein